MSWLLRSSLVLVVVTSARAQVCTGNAVAYHTRVRTAAGVMTNPAGGGLPSTIGSRQVGVEAAIVGVQRFIGVAVARRATDSVPWPPNDTPPFGSWQPRPGNSVTISGGLVLPRMPIDVGVCPIASLMQEWGPVSPDIGDGTRRETHAASIGVSTGVLADLNRGLSLTPFAASSYVLRQTMSRAGDWYWVDHQTTSSLAAEAGLSVVIANALTIRPSVQREFGLRHADQRTTGAVRFSYDFGRRSPPGRE